MSGNIRRLILGAALALPPVLVTCKSSEAPKVATTIVITPSPVTLSTVGRTQQLTAVVKDQGGGVMIGAVVTWSGGGAAATVSAAGLVTAVANGTVTVTAASGSASQGVTVTVAQVGAQITKVSGDLQTATVGQALGSPLVVLVNDSASNPAVGVTVAFATTGGGSIGTAAATTGPTGQAQSTWTLGQTAGSQSATATVTGATGSPLSFTATANAGAAKSVAIQAGNAQTADSGTTVAVAPAVIVKDTFNNVKAGMTVTFSTTAGNGTVTGAVQTTNASGIATVGSWTLGKSGTDTLTATVTGTGITGNPVNFTATSLTPGAPASVAAYVGNNQIGLVGWGVNVRPAVRVLDSHTLPVAGVTVTFAVTGGGGSGTSLVTTTNASGVAQVGSWVLGGTAGTNAMTATVTGTGITGNPVTFADTGYAAGYTITLINYGATPPAAAIAAFDSAQAKWQRLIYRPLTNIQVMDTGNQCGANEPAVNQATTGLIILWSVDSIDGPGKILANAGPCGFRPSGNHLPALGIMKFDSADIGNLIAGGTLNSVILHEMGHVIGFGTMWDYAPITCLQLPSTPPGTIQDTYFSCPEGRAAFDSVGGTSYTGGGSSPPAGNKVPVENCGTSPYVSPTCGTGTVNGHWREVVMTNELMTGYIGTPPNPLSIVSVAAQEDLGYVVNYSAADTYVHTFTTPVVGGASPIWLGDDIRHGPIYVIGSDGRLIPIKRP